MKENEMIHTSRVLIVEGKYDAARLSHRSRWQQKRALAAQLTMQQEETVISVI